MPLELKMENDRQQPSTPKCRMSRVKQYTFPVTHITTPSLGEMAVTLADAISKSISLNEF